MGYKLLNIYIVFNLTFRGEIMNKVVKIIITFIIAFIISYLIVGYLKSNIGVAIHWIPGTTIWDKFREYYIRTFRLNILPSVILAVVSTFIISLVDRHKN